MLEGLREALRKFLSREKYEEAVNEFVKELQKELIKADVNLSVVAELSKKIKERALKEEPPLGVSRKEWFISIVYEELLGLFGGREKSKTSVLPPKRPWTILLVGLQGSGKTTTAAKIAYYYKLEGLKPALVCGDTFRPGAFEQLKRLAELAGIAFYGEREATNAVEVVKKGVEYFAERGFDVIIVDTAGRHHRDEDLLKEMADIARAIRPDEVMLVIDAGMGQQAYSIARKFHETVAVGSIVVTKVDGTAKGGGALSAVVATGATIKFLGTGEKIEELEPFVPSRFVSRILGRGDLEGLYAKMARIRAELSEEDLEKALEGKIDMRFVYKQLRSLRKLGPINKVLQMIPGFGTKLPLNLDEKELEEKVGKWIAIIESMTYEELEKPEIIDRSRARRIARGSGTSPSDVKELLEQHRQFKRMFKQLRKNKRILERFRREMGGG